MKSTKQNTQIQEGEVTNEHAVHCRTVHMRRHCTVHALAVKHTYLSFCVFCTDGNTYMALTGVFQNCGHGYETYRKHIVHIVNTTIYTCADQQ